ncbi:MAG: glucose-1-phosphate adenylyltransferase [Eubacteriales bacterium]|nr:glucose-1-phosphate adenylyltransferase [Eubacteriales bacterium]
MRKEIIAMLLAGGQGSRLGVLTRNSAKPAVSFGGKYKIIDFPLSNCINSGIDTVGVLTQYQPLSLNSHIGIGIAWDLDKNYGGVRILPPYEKEEGSEWYTGTANAIYQNIAYIDTYDPEYVLILSGDHIYKMDYGHMLQFHKEKNADLTIASMSVDWEEAHRFGILITQEDDRIVEFEEKPEKPRSNVASMGIYIFKWSLLKEALLKLKDIINLDFGKHVIPYLHDHHARIYAYQFHGYWKDVGTLDSYWHANMELIELLPEFNLYQEFWKIYTNSDILEPQYIAAGAEIERSIISEGCDIYGSVKSSVLGTHVKVGANTVIRDSIIMKDCEIGENCVIEKAVIADGTKIGNNVQIGNMPEAENTLLPKIYTGGIATIGEHTVIPEGVRIGKNTAVMGTTTYDDYVNEELPSGGALIKEEVL